MKKMLLPAIIGALFLCTSVSAQKVNTDSLSLISKISADQLKLGKLQNQVDQKTRNKQDASEQAQKSANENAIAATKLSNLPEDKKLARKADNKASDARSDSKNARKQAGQLDKLNQDILELKNKIAVEQAKLNNYIPNAPTTYGMPVKPDSTLH